MTYLCFDVVVLYGRENYMYFELLTTFLLLTPELTAYKRQKERISK